MSKKNKSNKKNGWMLPAGLIISGVAAYFLLAEETAAEETAEEETAEEETAEEETAEEETAAEETAAEETEINKDATKIVELLTNSKNKGTRSEAGNDSQAQAIIILETYKDQKEFTDLLNKILELLGANDIIELYDAFNFENLLELYDLFLDHNITPPAIVISDDEDTRTEAEKNTDQNIAKEISNLLKQKNPNLNDLFVKLETIVKNPTRFFEVITSIFENLNVKSWYEFLKNYLGRKDLQNRFIALVESTGVKIDPAQIPDEKNLLGVNLSKLF